MRVLIDIMARYGFMRCERGATAVEYALIIAMVVLAMVGALTSVANKTTGMWNNVSNEVLAH